MQHCLPPLLLLQAFPDDAVALSYHGGLPMAVDCLARSAQECDAAFYLLDSRAKEASSSWLPGYASGLKHDGKVGIGGCRCL
jgi:hypothetical protein